MQRQKGVRGPCRREQLPIGATWAMQFQISSYGRSYGHSPRNMEVAGVLPVLQVGPCHPGLHRQTSGVRHSPPFSQCLLQTTTTREVGQKHRRRQGRRQGVGGQERDYKVFLICFSVLSQKLTLQVTYNSTSWRGIAKQSNPVSNP